MHCPNCGNTVLNTTTTMQSKEQTIRYKRCPACLWNFTSVETIPDEHVVIPNSIRHPKKNPIPTET